MDANLFPGQDYNNARVFDFDGVKEWNQNKRGLLRLPWQYAKQNKKRLRTYKLSVDRTKNSRMGWSDVSLNMEGPIVDDMVAHFVDRWQVISWFHSTVICANGPAGTSYSPKNTDFKTQESTTSFTCPVRL